MIVGTRVLTVRVRYGADTLGHSQAFGAELERRLYAAIPKQRLQLPDGSTVEVHDVRVIRP